MIRLLLAVTGASGVWLIASRFPKMTLEKRLAGFLVTSRAAETDSITYPPLLNAGLAWSHAELRMRRATAVAAGIASGALMAQGDLFVAGQTRSIPVLMVLGGAAGAVVFSMWLTSRRQHRERQLLIELPTAVEVTALHLLAGDSVESAVRSVAGASGVIAYELRAALEATEAGQPLAETLHDLGRHSARPDAARFYRFLGEAHLSGGRLIDAMAMLARDYRADSERSLVAEGGRRALAAYGPILALMVPVTLLFLMYPTIAGLRTLAGG